MTDRQSPPQGGNCAFFVAMQGFTHLGSCGVRLPFWVSAAGTCDRATRADDYCDLWKERDEPT